MAAALQAEHEAAQGLHQTQQEQEQQQMPEAGAAAVGTPVKRSRRRRRTTAAATAAAADEAAHAAHLTLQQPTAAEQQQQLLQLPASGWSSAAEAWATHALRGAFLQQLRQLGDGGALLALLRDVEVPVQAVLSSMEMAGIGVDREALLRQQQQLQVSQLLTGSGQPCTSPCVHTCVCAPVVRRLYGWMSKLTMV
jgi:DNA polymerase I-like protein with 3'-5' exonuclease and polymerase domains